MYKIEREFYRCSFWIQQECDLSGSDEFSLQSRHFQLPFHQHVVKLSMDRRTLKIFRVFLNPIPDQIDDVQLRQHEQPPIATLMSRDVKKEAMGQNASFTLFSTIQLNRTGLTRQKQAVQNGPV